MKQTPLHTIHKNLGARFTEFAGWQMPVQYTGVGEEHRAVRKTAGLFDVSHMGEIEVAGPEAEEILQKLTCNDVSRLKTWDCQYSAFLNEKGNFVDDIIVNRLSPDRFLVCVNASNTEKDFAWCQPFETGRTKVRNVSSSWFQIALQGPFALSILEKAFGRSDRIPQKPFTLLSTTVEEAPVLITRTGYTGEDGVEIYGPPEKAEIIWSRLCDQGAVPCGLGARDTLRLEAALPLYGHEINDTIHPYEARLSWIVKLSKGDFIGRKALQEISGASREILLPKILVGIEMCEPGIARQGCRLFHNEVEIGFITSGTYSPFLDKAIALGYVNTSFAPEGTKLSIDIHHKKREAVVVPLPFYRK